MKKIFIFLCFLLTSCETIPTSLSSMSCPQNRLLNLQGASVSESDFGGVERWYAIDKYKSNKDVRLQVGHFKNIESFGFVLYENGVNGVEADFKRQGLDLRWNWEPDEFGVYRYSFIIQPDGTGLYFDFSIADNNKASPRAIFETHKF